MSYEGVEWRVCQKGHIRVWGCHDPDLPEGDDWACPRCGLPQVDRGTIDQTNGDEMGAWDEAHASMARFRRQWRREHPEDTEIVCWETGTIITHKNCGGVGVVCFCEDDYEPTAPYVRWAVLPDWTKDGGETTPQSVWLSGREQMFERTEPITLS